MTKKRKEKNVSKEKNVTYVVEMRRVALLLAVAASALAMGPPAAGVRRQMRWGAAQLASCACSSCAWQCVWMYKYMCAGCRVHASSGLKAGLTGAGGWGW